MKWLNTLLDRTVVFNFDRTGYERHARQFNDADLEVDLTGRHWVVTGANSGIGFETTLGLSRRGARVTMVCRNIERAEMAKKRIQETHGSADLDLIIADLSELRDIKYACEQLRSPIHGIVFNAGNMVDDKRTTSDGFELITALHLVGPLAMIQSLTTNLKRGAQDGPVRCIFVSSGGMYTQRMDQGALEPPPGPYDGTVHYARTKRGQVVLAEHLHSSLVVDGIAVHAMHPGWVNTPAVRRAMPTFHRLTKHILRTPCQGADTVVWLSCVSDSNIDKTNGFWFDRHRVPTHAFKRTMHDAEAKAAFIEALDAQVGRALNTLNT